MGKNKRILKRLGHLRTKLWFDVVSRNLGGKTPTWFWRNFDNSNGDRSTWERYKRGLRDALPHNGLDRVALVGAQYPGSCIYHRTAMWNVLSGDKLTTDEIITAIEAFDDPMRTIILAGGFAAPPGNNSID